MQYKNIIFDDVVNYRETSMFIGTCFCDWKCCTEIGADICLCQNSPAHCLKNKEIDNEKLVRKYLKLGTMHALVLGGFEPLWNNSWSDVLGFLRCFRSHTQDTIVIYTGYYENEVSEKIGQLKELGNVVVKFGRYRPNQKPHHDDVLGVNLANDEQYAKRIS